MLADDLCMQPVSTPGAPLADGGMVPSPLTAVVDPPSAEPSSTRKRRAYQVWERATLPDTERGEQWFVIGVDVPATSRAAALADVTGGRSGTFATVLAGEFVEETVDDPQGAIVESVTAGILDLVGESTLLQAGVTPSAVRAAARKAVMAGASDG